MRNNHSDVILNFLDYISRTKDIHLSKSGSNISKEDCEVLVRDYASDMVWQKITDLCLKMHPDFYLKSQDEQFKIRMQYTKAYKFFKGEL